MARVKEKPAVEAVETGQANGEVKVIESTQPETNDVAQCDGQLSVDAENQLTVKSADKEQNDIKVAVKNTKTPKTAKETNEGEKIEEEKSYESEIPDEIKRVLKRFPKELELYVDKWGGAYTKDTSHHLIKNAILYKNPFYNK